MTIRRLSMAAVLAPLLFLSAGAEASTLCDRLHARLADLPEATSNDRDNGRDGFGEASQRNFTGAISRRNIELRSARSEQRALGCSTESVTVINGDNEEACADLDNRIAAISADLEDMKARRRQDIAGSAGYAERRRVLVAMQTNRCEAIDSDLVSASVSGPDATMNAGTDADLGIADLGIDESRPRRFRNIIADLPPIGSEETSLRGPSDGAVSEPSLSDLSAPDLHRLTLDGPLRTMCVRTCDGSFFPISANATPDDFARDAQACSARCPGAETELYFHPLSGETQDMISAGTGNPYTDLPTAFAYKSGSPASRSQCGCRLPNAAAARSSGAGFSTLPGDAPAPRMSTPSDKAVVSITTDPAASKSLLPETTTATAPADAAPREIHERPYDPKANRVRQVGPTFLPTEESSIDLHHPAGPGYQPEQTN
ncbi:DUF2865 domain-containing protein [Rhizobium sp. Leaf371]|uniref:DUF2865 domain-containing protein n=1 Tax=Rhizobium sp. Leaf371 TaxID=1736355 RepID=UPI001FCDFAE8|nr:DUF2865 domain-containing protein [Rhizobium sp. Leaf371]